MNLCVAATLQVLDNAEMSLGLRKVAVTVPLPDYAYFHVHYREERCLRVAEAEVSRLTA
jgi:hypothetical protein